MARAQRTVARTVPGSLPVMQQKATRSSRITATFRFFLGFRKRARKPMSTLTWNPEITTTWPRPTRLKWFWSMSSSPDLSPMSRARRKPASCWG